MPEGAEPESDSEDDSDDDEDDEDDSEEGEEVRKILEHLLSLRYRFIGRDTTVITEPRFNHVLTVNHS